METNEVIVADVTEVIAAPLSVRRRLEKGVTTVEYAVIIAAMAGVIYLAGGTLANGISAAFAKVVALMAK